MVGMGLSFHTSQPRPRVGSEKLGLRLLPRVNDYEHQMVDVSILDYLVQKSKPTSVAPPAPQAVVFERLGETLSI